MHPSRRVRPLRSSSLIPRPVPLASRTMALLMQWLTSRANRDSRRRLCASHALAMGADSHLRGKPDSSPQFRRW